MIFRAAALSIEFKSPGNGLMPLLQQIFVEETDYVY